MRERRPGDLVEYSAETRDDGTVKMRWKEVERRRTEFGGLSATPSGVHLYHTGSMVTVCGLSRSEVASINVALREGKHVCSECER